MPTIPSRRNSSYFSAPGPGAINHVLRAGGSSSSPPGRAPSSSDSGTRAESRVTNPTTCSRCHMDTPSSCRSARAAERNVKYAVTGSLDGA